MSCVRREIPFCIHGGEISLEMASFESAETGLLFATGPLKILRAIEIRSRRCRSGNILGIVTTVRTGSFWMDDVLGQSSARYLKAMKRRLSELDRIFLNVLGMVGDVLSNFLDVQAGA